jgi:hypothetical protein
MRVVLQPKAMIAGLDPEIRSTFPWISCGFFPLGR